jgi:hypothetical protein
MSDLKTTRGGALKRLALVAGGAVGLGFAGKKAFVDEPQAATATPVSRGGTSQTIVLQGHQWRMNTPGVKPGEMPGPADLPAPFGRFVDASGKDLGAFSAANLAGAAGAIQLHTFDLVDGTILGIGAGGVHENPYAIVGGTGRFAGARGTYVAQQSPRELGGDGTAEFTLTLTA